MVLSSFNNSHISHLFMQNTVFVECTTMTKPNIFNRMFSRLLLYLCRMVLVLLSFRILWTADKYIFFCAV